MAEQRVTSIGLEVLNTGDGSSVRTSMVGVDVLRTGAAATMRVGSVSLEVLSSLAVVSPPSSNRQPVVIICQ